MKNSIKLVLMIFICSMFFSGCKNMNNTNYSDDYQYNNIDYTITNPTVQPSYPRMIPWWAE